MSSTSEDSDASDSAAAIVAAVAAAPPAGPPTPRFAADRVAADASVVASFSLTSSMIAIGALSPLRGRVLMIRV